MYKFFSIISRMKYIYRWGLMRNTEKENLREHSHDTAILAHALVTIENKRFGGALNGERAALLALYHDCGEIITGDMPTPIKYHNEKIRSAYKEIEGYASSVLLAQLPDWLKGEYEPLLSESEPEYRFVKMADTLSAYIKCITELRSGNSEFSSAALSLEKKLKSYESRSLDLFMEEFLPAYGTNLDDIRN